MRLLVIAALPVLYGLVGVQGCSSEYTCIGGDKYTKCELAKELIRLGVARSEVAHWVCAAYYESKFCTCVVYTPTRDHGIFQINGYWNCDDGGVDSKDGCNKPCSAFTNKDLADDVACMRKILRWQGNDWSTVSFGYRDHCTGIVGTYLDDCTNL